VEIELENGVPIPPKTPRPSFFAKGALKRAMLAMGVGQSFLYPADRRESVYNSAGNYGLKIRAHNAEQEGFIRVWRVE
jgi:hypothetical protein